MFLAIKNFNDLNLIMFENLLFHFLTFLKLLRKTLSRLLLILSRLLLDFDNTNTKQKISVNEPL